MIIRQWATDQEVETRDIQWPSGDIWEDICGAEWVENNPLFVVNVALMFGKTPYFLESSVQEALPEKWEKIPFRQKIGEAPMDPATGLYRPLAEEFFYSMQGTVSGYLCGDRGWLEPGEYPWMLVGMGSPLFSALCCTLICLPEDKERFIELGWDDIVMSK